MSSSSSQTWCKLHIKPKEPGKNLMGTVTTQYEPNNNLVVLVITYCELGEDFMDTARTWRVMYGLGENCVKTQKTWRELSEDSVMT